MIHSGQYYQKATHLNGVGTGTMARSHIAIALRDSTADGQITVLAVHVVGTGTGIVAQPDAEVLHAQRSLLQDTLDRDDLTGGLLELTQLPQEVPETGLGHDMVRCEDVHLEQRRIRILLRGQLTPDDLVFLQLWIGGTNDNRIRGKVMCRQTLAVPCKRSVLLWLEFLRGFARLPGISSMNFNMF